MFPIQSPRPMLCPPPQAQGIRFGRPLFKPSLSRVQANGPENAMLQWLSEPTGLNQLRYGQVLSTLQQSAARKGWLAPLTATLHSVLPLPLWMGLDLLRFPFSSDDPGNSIMMNDFEPFDLCEQIIHETLPYAWSGKSLDIKDLQKALHIDSYDDYWGDRLSAVLKTLEEKGLVATRLISKYQFPVWQVTPAGLKAARQWQKAHPST